MKCVSSHPTQLLYTVFQNKNKNGGKADSVHKPYKGTTNTKKREVEKCKNASPFISGRRGALVLRGLSKTPESTSFLKVVTGRVLIASRTN